jgi:hypothetical protein
MNTAYERLNAALQSAGCVIKDNGHGKLRSQCPAHTSSTPDSRPLAVTAIEGSALVHCHAGCELDDILAGLELSKPDLFDDRKGAKYTYPGGREVNRKPDKGFWQGGDKADRTLFRSDRIGDAAHVYVTEGEKDVLAAEAAGAVAVCPAMGAGKADKFDWTPLSGKTVTVVADNDKPGEEHAAQVAKLVTATGAKSVRIVRAAVGKDLADHIAAGKALDELVPISGGTGAPVDLDAALATFGKWLHMDDTAPVLAVAATITANLADGDPVWLLIVGPPSGGKTEILSSCAGLPYMVPAATISEAALLSGTAKRERTKEATGGLLRQIGDFGILLAKDFTSVLSQNKDTAKSAIAALREIYDGSWDRPIGSDGGRVLHWDGKCGFIGGVTPSYDRYGTIVNTLGDRYLLLRLPDVAAEEQSEAALRSTEQEVAMRAELAAAMTGLIAGANRDLVYGELTESDKSRLKALAIFTARARTAVERDGYTGDLLVMPQAEGPARLVKAFRRLYGGLCAIGVDEDNRWDLLRRVAIDCVPTIRAAVLDELVGGAGYRRTSEIAANVEMVTKTAHRILDDLALIGVAVRTKKNGADNSPDLWDASDWLRQYWQEVGQRTTTKQKAKIKRDSETPHDGAQCTPFSSSLSHFDEPDAEHQGEPDPEPDAPDLCHCGYPPPPGYAMHHDCAAKAADREGTLL